MKLSLMAKSSTLAAVAAVGFFAAPVSASTTRTICAQSVWVREADLSHVSGVLYKGDKMQVDRYVTKSNGNSTWAVGTAYTRQGNKYGYVLVSPGVFC